MLPAPSLRNLESPTSISVAEEEIRRRLIRGMHGEGQPKRSAVLPGDQQPTQDIVLLLGLVRRALPVLGPTQTPSDPRSSENVAPSEKVLVQR